MRKYHCIIVDDDEVARLKVVSIARLFPTLHIIDHFSSAASALAVIQKKPVDILFLDIDMPAITGLQLRKKLMEIPICVFITSHPEHAVESFALETFDYLIKPLRLERFQQTMARIEEFMKVREKAALYESSFGDDFIYVKEGYERIKVRLYEVSHIEALKDYSILVTPHKRYCVLSSIGNLLKETPFQSFVRIHRSFAVQKQFVEKVGTHSLVLTNQTSLPIGQSFKGQLAAAL